MIYHILKWIYQPNTSLFQCCVVLWIFQNQRTTCSSSLKSFQNQRTIDFTYCRNLKNQQWRWKNQCWVVLTLFFENHWFWLLWVLYENHFNSYCYSIKRGLREQIRVSGIFSKKNQFPEATILPNTIAISFLNWSSQPGYQSCKLNF